MSGAQSTYMARDNFFLWLMIPSGSSTSPDDSAIQRHVRSSHGESKHAFGGKHDACTGTCISDWQQAELEVPAACTHMFTYWILLTHATPPPLPHHRRCSSDHWQSQQGLRTERPKQVSDTHGPPLPQLLTPFISCMSRC